MIVRHNHPVRCRGRWYLSASSTRDCFIFVSSERIDDVLKKPEDGWTLNDALSFHSYLMGWEPSVCAEQELHL